MKINSDRLLLIVRNDIKSLKCKECEKLPDAIIKDGIVTYKISCEKQCKNKKLIDDRIFEISENIVKQY